MIRREGFDKKCHNTYGRPAIIYSFGPKFWRRKGTYHGFCGLRSMFSPFTDSIQYHEHGIPYPENLAPVFVLHKWNHTTRLKERILFV